MKDLLSSILFLYPPHPLPPSTSRHPRPTKHIALHPFLSSRHLLPPPRLPRRPSHVPALLPLPIPGLIPRLITFSFSPSFQTTPPQGPTMATPKACSPRASSGSFTRRPTSPPPPGPRSSSSPPGTREERRERRGGVLHCSTRFVVPCCGVAVAWPWQWSLQWPWPWPWRPCNEHHMYTQLTRSISSQ